MLLTPADLVLTTGRTVLMPFTAADGPELLRVFQDPDVRSGLLDDVLVGPEWVDDEIVASQERFVRFGVGLWAVRLAGEQGIVGFVGFRECLEPPRLELLYGLLPSCHGKGLATEVTTRVCDFAFRDLGCPAIHATTDLPNRASARVLRHLGMELVRTDDDTAHFAIDLDTWYTRHQGTAP